MKYSTGTYLECRGFSLAFSTYCSLRIETAVDMWYFTDVVNHQFVLNLEGIAVAKSNNGNNENEIKKVFISYSWDSEKHKDWVAGLVSKLRREYGVDAIFDENSGQNNLNRMMVNEILSCDKIISIITKNYTEKANSWTGGVGIEVQLYFDHVFRDSVNVIPVLRDECGLPKVLTGVKYVDFSSAGIVGYPKFDELVRRIYDIQTYNIPADVKRTRTVKTRKVPDPITGFEKKVRPKPIETHIVKFIEATEKAKDDNVSAYDLLSEICNKDIDEKFMPSIYRLYETRKNNGHIFSEENMLWADIFVNIWSNSYSFTEIAVQNIIELLNTKDFFVVKTIVENLIRGDSIDDFYIIDDVLKGQLSDALVMCLEINNHILAKDILIVLQTVTTHTKVDIFEMLRKLGDNTQISYFQLFTYHYRASYFFRESDIDELLQFADVNDAIKDDIFYIISKLNCVKSIEVLYENKIYDKDDLIDTIISFSYTSEQNKEYLRAFRKKLDSYPNKKYVQSGADKVKADILEYLIEESDIDKFMENFPKDYHGLDDDDRLIRTHLSKLELSEQQSEKLREILLILDESE